MNVAASAMPRGKIANEGNSMDIVPGQAAPHPFACTGCIATLASPPSHTALEQLHQFAESLGNAVDARDSGTFNHSWEVADISRMLAEAVGLSPQEAETVHLAGHLHDIGKIGVPDAVLKKQGKLTQEEWSVMKRHPETGAAIIRPIAAFGRRGGVADIILSHHERFDGNGYPQGLEGNLIPLGARIIAVADTMSALLQDRPYRNGTDFASAMAEIRRCSGTQLDPAIVLALEKVHGRVSSYFAGQEPIRTL